MRRGTPDDLLSATLRLFEERERFAQVVKKLPVTLCHRDMIPSNAFVRWMPRAGHATGEAEMVAIDWQHIGIDTLGRDLGSLVPSGVHRLEVDADQLPEIDAVAFEAYLDGLREVGWQGDTRRIRLAYCATSALRYGLIPAGVLASREGMTERIERTIGRPIEDWLDAWVQMQRFVMRLADEARELMGIV